MGVGVIWITLICCVDISGLVVRSIARVDKNEFEEV
jgi:hypothetical protein